MDHRNKKIMALASRAFCIMKLTRQIRAARVLGETIRLRKNNYGTAKQFVSPKYYSIRSPSKTSFARVSRLSMRDAVCLQCFHAVLWVYLERREWTDYGARRAPAIEIQP